MAEILGSWICFVPLPRATRRVVATWENGKGALNSGAIRAESSGVAAALAVSLALGFPSPAHPASSIEAPFILDSAKVLPSGKAKELEQQLKGLQKERGWRVRVVTRTEPGAGTTGAALRALWDPDDRTIVVIEDLTSPNILNFKVGAAVNSVLPRQFFSELQSRYGNRFFVDQEGETAALVGSLEKVQECLQRPGGCRSVPGLISDLYWLTLATSIVGGCVFGFAARIPPSGRIQASWQWVVAFAPLWLLLAGLFGVLPIVSRTSELEPLLKNLAGFVAGALALYWTPILGPPPNSNRHVLVVKEEALMEKEDEPHPIELEWVFGFSSHITGGAVDLRTDSRDSVCYVAGHTIVIFNRAIHQQIVLQGHVHQIQCLVSDPKRDFLLSADCGPDASLILWDATTGQVQKAVMLEQTQGIVAMDVSADSSLVATLSAVYSESVQELSIWDNLLSSDKPLVTAQIPLQECQICVRFNVGDMGELVTNGKRTVFFWRHHKEQNESGVAHHSLDSCQAEVKAKELKQTVGMFTHSVFIPTTNFALTGTVDGDLVTWIEPSITPKEGQAGENQKARLMRAVKVVRVHATAITALVTPGNYIATGDSGGFVRFFDSRLGLTAWFEELAAGSISSLSFSAMDPLKHNDALYALQVAPFLIGTKNAHLILLRAAIFEQQPGSLECKGDEVMEPMPEKVEMLSAHPSQTQFAMMSAGNILQIQDYETRRMFVKREFSKLKLSAMTYSPLGTTIACAFSNGILKIVNSTTLQDVQNFSFTRLSVPLIAYSQDAGFMALSDASSNAALLTFEPVREKWEYRGKYRSHACPIVAIHFARDENGTNRMFSIGLDMRVVEYDLPGSVVGEGLKLRGSWPLNYHDGPTAIVSDATSKLGQLQLIVSDSGYKVRMYDTDKFQCKKTFRGPTFGSPISHLMRIREPKDEKDYLVFAAKEQVLGLMTYPSKKKKNLQVMGLVGHSGPISSIVISYDARYLITSGQGDSVVNVWRVDLTVLEKVFNMEEDALGGNPAIFRGPQVQALLQKLRESFFCAQIRSQGEESSHERNLDDTLQLDQLPELLRALRVDLSTSDIRDILQEIGRPMKNGGLDLPKRIKFTDFISIYANHKAVIPLDVAQIRKAFAELGANGENGTLKSELLLKALTEEGDAMTRDELHDVMAICLGETPGKDIALSETVDATWFAKNLIHITS